MITNITRVQLELKGTEERKTSATDQQLLNYIRDIDRRIANYNIAFEPQYKTRKFTPSRANTNSSLGLLSLNDTLLEVDSITIGATAYTYGTQIISSPADGQFPIRSLQIADPLACNPPSWYPCCVNTLNSIVIQGFWGMRRFYDTQGWFDSGATAPILTSTDRTFILATGAITDTDIYGRAPMLSPGNLLRIEDEMLEVVSVDLPDNSLTVLRGWRGTTAVGHAAGQVIQIWEPEGDISDMATRQVALRYSKRGAFTALTTPDGMLVSYPADLLYELKATVNQYSYVGYQ